MAATGETAWIARFLRPFSTPPDPRVVAGPGDDCALTRPAPGRLLVSKVDQVVEGVHFGPAFSAEEIGHKALAVALSDLAAAAATPRHALVAVVVPPGTRSGRLDGIARGMAALARKHGVSLVGGNFSRGRELSLAVTLLGEVAPGRTLRRSGARPGDALVVSGSLGGAALGLTLLAAGRPRRLTAAARAQLAPTPRVALGLAAGGLASAGIDLSDGLLRDLGHLCERSGVGAELSLPELPLQEELLPLGPRGLRLALSGGEDYELLLAVPPARLAALTRAAARLRERLTPIGRITGTRGIRLLDAAGAEVRAPGHRGFDHFAAAARGG